MDPTTAVKTLHETYGQLAFGLVSLIVLVAVVVVACISLWKHAIKPLMEAAIKISDAQALLAERLEAAAEHMELGAARFERLANSGRTPERTPEDHAPDDRDERRSDPRKSRFIPLDGERRD